MTVTIEVSSILRKVMIYPLHAYNDTDSKYLVIDYQSSFDEVHCMIDDLIVPVYPPTVIWCKFVGKEMKFGMGTYLRYTFTLRIQHVLVDK